MLTAARTLLVERGPAALTLAEVAAATGVRHTNVLHHFGSAAGLRTALIGQTIEEVGAAAEEAVQRLRAGEAPLAQIVDTLFDGLADGGLARLLAWATLSEEAAVLERLHQQVTDRVGRLASSAQPANRVLLTRAAHLLISQAFADALLGDGLAGALGQERDAMRTAVVEILAAWRAGVPF